MHTNLFSVRKVAKMDQLLRSVHSQPLVSFRMKYPPKILKNPEVLMLQYQGTFDQRKDGWHSSVSRMESTETGKIKMVWWQLSPH